MPCAESTERGRGSNFRKIEHGIERLHFVRAELVYPKMVLRILTIGQTVNISFGPPQTNRVCKKLISHLALFRDGAK